jgi:hypothetical protein
MAAGTYVTRLNTVRNTRNLPRTVGRPPVSRSDFNNLKTDLGQSIHDPRPVRLTYRDCKTSTPVSPYSHQPLSKTGAHKSIQRPALWFQRRKLRERSTHAHCCCSHHSCAKNKTFSLPILHAKAVKYSSFPLHGSCADVTDQSLTFLELSIFFGWEIRMFPVQTGFLYYFPVEISPRNSRREERRIITTSGRSCTFFSSLYIQTGPYILMVGGGGGNDFENYGWPH